MQGFRWTFLIGLGLFRNNAFAKSSRETCGAVPSNEEMNAVLRPTSLLIAECLPIVEKYNLKLTVLFELAADVCEDFDKCFKNENFNLTPDSPSLVCIEGLLREKVVNVLPENMRESGVIDFIRCMSPLDNMKRNEIFAVMHWYLALAP